MHLRIQFAVSLLLFAFGVSSLDAATRTVISYASFNERTAGILLVAEDQGFFRKQDLDVRLVYVRAGNVALSALAAGESQFYFGSGTGVTLGAVAGGLDGVFVAGLVNRLTGTFVVHPQIKTPADLKGRNIGVQSIGGGIWMITMLVLDHWGIEPKRDHINLRIIGDESVLAQALATNIIEGSYFGYTLGSILKRQGFNVLADLATLKIPYQSTGVFVRRSFLKSSPDTVERVLRAMTQATAYIEKPENKTSVMTSLYKGLRLPRFQDAEEGYELMRTLYDQRIYPNDDRIVRRLEKEGAFERAR